MRRFYRAHRSTPLRSGRERHRVLFLFVLGALAGAGASQLGCSHAAPESQTPQLTKDQLMDPATCGTCHGSQYREWAGSMHAFAADDPLFLAMNARGQRETGGTLGPFCVQCHAPLAVKTGATKDGLNLSSVDPKLKGITCFYCHSIDAVEGAHNAPAHVSDDGVMRAAIADPIAGAPHAASYSKFHDGDRPEAAKMCGTCHDISNPNGVPIARTYTEWQQSLFAHPDPKVQLTCPSCHMPGRDAPAASVPNAPTRRVHDHRMPGVDVALTDFVEADDQRKAVQANLDPSLVTKLCVQVDAGNTIAEVSLDDAFAGHDWPSGAAYHRRAWVEVVAYDASGAEIFHTGAVPDDQSVASQAAKDPLLWHLGDQLYDGAGKTIETLWDATKYDSALLLPAVTTDPKDPAFYHAKITDFTLPSDKQVDKVTTAVHIRPVDFDFVDDLVGSGDLDPSFRTKLDTFTLAGTQLTWTRADPGLFKCVPQ